MKPPIPFWVPQIGEEEERLVREVLASQYLNDGEVTRVFEQRLTALLGCKYAVAVTSGTAALFLSLSGLGIGPGDEVIVPDVTFIATANAVTLTGATVVLVDIDPETLTLDPEAVRRAITPRTKAVIPVHVSGRAGHLDEIVRIASTHGLSVIEDAAEALMSRHQGKCLGTIGRVGCLSFSPAKIITTGQGGAVLTNDEALAVRLRELKDQGRSVRGTGGDDVHRRLGYNFKFTDLQAAVGLGQLETLSARMAQMQRTYSAYRKGLVEVSGVTMFDFRVDEGESPQWVDVRCDQRDALVKALRAQGAECRNYWFPLHTQAPYRQPDGCFPRSTAVIPTACWLPSALSLSEADVIRVCGWIRDFMSGQGNRLSAMDLSSVK